MKIPIGNFGNAITAPAPRANIPAAAFRSSEGLQQVGSALVQASAGMMQAERQAQEEEAKQAKLQMKADATSAILEHEAEVGNIAIDIQQQLTDGRLKHSDAAKLYSERVGKIKVPTIEGIDPATSQNFANGLQRTVRKGEMTIGREAEKARAVDFRMKLDGILDMIGKKAGLPGANVDSLNANLDTEDADAMGRQAYGANWEKVRQDRKDANWNDSLNQQAMSVQDSLQGIRALKKEITQGTYADKLDSNRRNSIVGKLDAYETSLIQRNEAAAARAARQQELALKKAEAELQTFQAMHDKGAILDPNYIDRAIAATKGTPQQAAIIALAKSAQETGGIASQPIRNQEAALTQIDTMIAQRGRTPELDKRREQVAKVLAGSQRDLTENGLRAGLERGVITELAPLDISTPEAFAGSVAKRMEQAEQVGQWAGKAVSPLDANEAMTVRSMLESLPAKQRSMAVATIAQSVGPRAASAIAEQIDKQDKALSLAFATAGSKTTAGRYTSELILKGATAIKDGTAMKDDKKVTGWKATIAGEIDGAFPNEKAATAVKEAAYYIAAGMAAENGGTVSTSNIRQAVTLAVGGSIIERNGKKLPIPAEMEADDFEKRIKSVSPNEIIKQVPEGNVRVGGAEMSAQEFAASIPGQELIFAGPGRYAVIVKGRPVTNSAGRPIIIGIQ